MKGTPIQDDEQPADSSATTHGLECPNCGGNLVKSIASDEHRELKAGGKLDIGKKSAKYIYACDGCDYTEEVAQRGG